MVLDLLSDGSGDLLCCRPGDCEAGARDGDSNKEQGGSWVGKQGFFAVSDFQVNSALGKTSCPANLVALADLTEKSPFFSQDQMMVSEVSITNYTAATLSHAAKYSNNMAKSRLGPMALAHVASNMAALTIRVDFNL